MKFNKILEKYKPTKQDELELKKKIDSIINKIKIKGAKVILGGSGGKNTWLKGTHDVDIYVKFNYSQFKNKSDEISDILHKALEKHFKVERLHGSRDYFQIHQGTFTFEIVPIIDIKNAKQAKNITDFSHLHVAYVKKYPKLVNDIRLAKIFARANKFYGAESYIRGLSGYCLELLVIHYKSFTKLLKAASKWSSTHLIGSKKLANKLNASKKQSPLILIDPVQPDRNAAAALSREKYQMFITSAKQFTKNPSEKFFYPKETNFKTLNKKGKLIFLETSPLKGKKDVIGAKMLKAFEFIEKQITFNDFKLIKANWKFEKPSYFYFIVNPKPLPQYFKHYGPPKKHLNSVKKFKKKYKNIYFEGNKTYIKKKREFTTIEPLIKNLIKEPNVKKRVASIKISKCKF